MAMKILINSRTSGKYRREVINGRSHIVTRIMPIRGDIAMNGIYYPDAQVAASFAQMDMMLAPSSHPVINGVHVSATHPVAINTHNIGGFLRKPEKKGKRVFADYCLDETVANGCDAGKETIRRIEAGEKIGVSTGLTIDRIVNQSGKDDYGKEYQAVGEGYKFDHVATLLNEAAAGEHAGTELVLNADADLVVNELQVNELSCSELHEAISAQIRSGRPDGEWSWLSEVYTDSRYVVFSRESRGTPAKYYRQDYTVENDEVSLAGDPVEVVRKVEYYPVGEKEMEINEQSAKEFLGKNGFDFAGYDEFKANAADFAAFKAARQAKADALIGEIVANSELTADMLKGKPESELLALQKLAVKKTADRAPAGTTHQNAQDKKSCDYSA